MVCKFFYNLALLKKLLLCGVNWRYCDPCSTLCNCQADRRFFEGEETGIKEAGVESLRPRTVGATDLRKTPSRCVTLDVLCALHLRVEELASSSQCRRARVVRNAIKRYTKNKVNFTHREVRTLLNNY